MTKILFSICLLLFLNSCSLFHRLDNRALLGTYWAGNSLLETKISFYEDGTYAYYDDQSAPFDLATGYCTGVRSRGIWRLIDHNMIEITSENFYQRLTDCRYELVKDHKGSPDSLYIEVFFSSDFDSFCDEFNLCFNFNDENEKKIIACKNLIQISKNDYRIKLDTTNTVVFSLEANPSGDINDFLHLSSFDVFKENINLYNTNYIKIKLPYFTWCSYEFIPYYKDIIYIRSKRRLSWDGLEWRKKR